MKKYIRRLEAVFLLFTFLGASSLLLLMPGSAHPQAQSSIQIYFFYAEDCQPCQPILMSYLPTLKSMFPSLEIKTFDLRNPAHYELLRNLEKRFKRRGDELPVVFIGDHILSGEIEVMERLNPLIMEYQVKGGTPLPPIQLDDSLLATRDSKIIPTASPVELAYFYQKGCPKCDRANYLLKYLLKKYSHLHIKEIDLNTMEGKRLNELLANRMNLPMEKRLIAPSIFIGQDYLSPEEITEFRVEALIEKYSVGVGESVGKIPLSPEEIKKAEESIVNRFESFGILAIFLAGLIEGMNPCALATLVFFISYLTMVGRKRKEIFWVGMGFSGTGFVTHLLLGLGILSFVQHLSFLPLFSRIVYLVTFVLALFLGVFSLYDYIQLKKGRPSKMKLQVPDFLKRRIHRTIRARSNELEGIGQSQPLRLLLAAVVIGFIVTLLQSACTSQVYLPTILFVTNIPSLRGSAVFYLILYNLVYIAPLLVIFGIVYWGVTSEQLAVFLQKRASMIKLLTSFFFFALAGILITIIL